MILVVALVLHNICEKTNLNLSARLLLQIKITFWCSQVSILTTLVKMYFSVTNHHIDKRFLHLAHTDLRHNFHSISLHQTSFQKPYPVNFYQNFGNLRNLNSVKDRIFVPSTPSVREKIYYLKVWLLLLSSFKVLN